jgi:Mitochondrial ribosomal protein subunit
LDSMATARLSPAASLLRSSRLFSIPPPLSPPASLLSPTATQHYPTHAAIETPPTSWDRGDWGFKRSLPLKSTTKTGTTTIRVQKGIDSIEHITDFESAADHVLTLQKWKELNLPIRFIKKTTADDNTSVFEPKVDNIASSVSTTHRRWRYKGPWLAGQPGWEFDTLLRRVAARKLEFQTYVRERLSTERNLAKRQEAIDAGLDLNQGEAIGITDEEFDEHMHYLRATPSAFGPLIAEFLDLPEGPNPSASTTASKDSFSYGRATVAAAAYKESGPPKTHPSAGISYYRSGAHVSNHPIFGPQQHNPPVAARVVRPSIRRKPGEVGIAGFVAAGWSSATLLNAAQASVQAKSWQPTPGGLKLAARPTTAAIDSDGRLVLSADTASQESRRMYGLLAEAKPREAPPVTRTRLGPMPKLDQKTYRSSRQPAEAQEWESHLENLLRRTKDKDHI